MRVAYWTVAVPALICCEPLNHDAGRLGVAQPWLRPGLRLDGWSSLSLAIIQSS
jgi:hypothetical protein